jgi:hypothetical protein
MSAQTFVIIWKFRSRPKGSESPPHKVASTFEKNIPQRLDNSILEYQLILQQKGFFDLYL